MNLIVEWASPKHLEDPDRAQLSTGAVPVIRVDALRRWIQQQNRYTTGLDDLLAQLPEE